ncbi:MAG: zinc ribbon domain-containing protein [Acidobacteriota bacterium]
MYCPNCGDQTTQGLKYCKRCGAGLSTSTAPIEAKASVGAAMGTMLFLVALVSIAGFIALFSTVYSLGESPGFNTKALIAIMAFGGATVVGVIGLLVWLLLRLTTSSQPLARREKTEKPGARDYAPQQLPASPISMPSVTENTTRNFDPAVYGEKGARE